MECLKVLNYECTNVPVCSKLRHQAHCVVYRRFGVTFCLKSCVRQGAAAVLFGSLVTIYQTTRCHFPANRNMHIHGSDDFVFCSVTVIKERGMRLAGHVAYIAELRHKFSILVGTREGTDHFETFSIVGRIILKCV